MCTCKFSDERNHTETSDEQKSRCRQCKEHWDDSTSSPIPSFVFDNVSAALNFVRTQAGACKQVLVTGSMHLVGCALSAAGFETVQ